MKQAENAVEEVKSPRWSTLDFTIALLAALSPIFILANELNGDEWTKGGIGAVVGGVTLAVTQIVRMYFTGKTE